MQLRIWFVVLVLAGSAASHVAFSRAPQTPARESLAGFPAAIADWSRDSDGSVTEAVAGVLKADDVLLRRYRDSSGHVAEIFVAHYAFQRAGETMHSPKNCLPGWGWEIVSTDRVRLGTADGPIVNRNIIRKEGRRAVVLYWYQGHGRVIASEYAGKAYLVWDALRYNRRDGAIVRFTVPVMPGDDLAATTARAVALASASSEYLPAFLPD